MKALVIGAGMAGLSAATHLAEQGAEVLVLEARDRLGGRVATDSTRFGVPVEMGARWIHGIENNPLAKLSRRHGAATVKTPFRDLHFASATPYDDADTALALTSKYYEWGEEACLAMSRKEPDVPLSYALHDYAEDWGRIRDGRSQSWADYVFSLDEGIEADAISLRSFEDDDPFEGPDVVFRQGYKALVDVLARDITVELGTVVREVRYDIDRGAEVLCEDGRQFDADAVIVTLPLAVLKAGDVRFEPELPLRKRRAIEALGAGLNNKLILHFAEPFWPTSAWWLAHVETAPRASSLMFSLYPLLEQAILEGYVAGRYAARFEERSDEELVAEALEDLGNIYGTLPALRGHHVTRWASDPYARMAYSYIPVGARGRDMNRLAEPIGEVVFFAGEACDLDNYATAHGAYMSGRRVGRKLAWLWGLDRAQR